MPNVQVRSMQKEFIALTIGKGALSCAYQYCGSDESEYVNGKYRLPTRNGVCR